LITDLTDVNGDFLVNPYIFKYYAADKDFNGDGIKDLQGNLTSTGPLFSVFNSDTLFFDHEGELVTAMNNVPISTAESADLNADGLNDVIYINTNSNNSKCPLNGDRRRSLTVVSWDNNKSLNQVGNVTSGDAYFHVVNEICNIDLHTFESIFPGEDDTILDPHTTQIFLKDMNADGRVDLLLNQHAVEEHLELHRSTRLEVHYNNTDYSSCGNEQCHVSFETEGKLLMTLPRRYNSDGQGTEDYRWDQIMAMDDLNGDGYIDIHTRTLKQDGPVPPQNIGPIYIFSDQVFFGSPIQTAAGGLDISLVMRPLRELGLDDFYCDYAVDQRVVSSSECRLLHPDTNIQDAPNYQLLDINNDGLKDFLYYDNDPLAIKSWKVRLNQGGDFTGELFGPTIKSTINSDANTSSLFQGEACSTNSQADANEYRQCSPYFTGNRRFTDLNGDGNVDMVYPDHRLDITAAEPDPKNIIFNSCTGVEINSNTQSTGELTAGVFEQSNVYLYDTMSFNAVFNSPSMFNDQTTDPVTNGSNDNFETYCSYSSLAEEADANPNIQRKDLYRQAKGGPLLEVDEGVYRHNTLSFKITLDATGEPELALGHDTDTGIYQSLEYGLVNDVSGDGLGDYLSLFGCNNRTVDDLFARRCRVLSRLYTENITNLTAGSWDWNTELLPLIPLPPPADPINLAVPNSQFIKAHNNLPVPGQVIQITKPDSGMSYQWDYHPISSDLSGDTSRIMPLYSLPERGCDTGNCGDGYIDEVGGKGEYFYFNSSMYVVSEMRTSTGLLDASDNETISRNQYSYEEAVYNNQGRGFQGFRTISVLNQPNILSPDNITESISTFHQVFPLAGKLESVDVIKNVDNQMRSASLSSYQWYEENQSEATMASKGIQFNPLRQMIETTYRDDGNLAAHMVPAQT